MKKKNNKNRIDIYVIKYSKRLDKYNFFSDIN